MVIENKKKEFLFLCFNLSKIFFKFSKELILLNSKSNLINNKLL